MLIEVPSRREDRTTAPLSFQQELAWKVPHRSTYSPPLMTLRLEGNLQMDCLQAAIEMIVSRHESLRTVFAVQDEAPKQVIRRSMPVELELHDLSDLKAEQREGAARILVREASSRPYSLSTGPLLRTLVIRLGHNHQLLAFGIHHIVNDFWSMKVFLSELVHGYAAALQGQDASLPMLRVQYADFAAWQRYWETQPSFEVEKEYWIRRLRAARPLFLPSTSAGERNPQSNVLSRTLSPELSSRVRTFARANGITLFMTLLAALLVILHRLTSEKDVSIATLVSNRQARALEPLIGFFAHSVILQVVLAGNPNLHDLLIRVRESSLDAQEHQGFPCWRLAADESEGRLHTPWISFALQAMPSKVPEFEDLRTTMFESTGATLFENVQTVRTHWLQTWQAWEYHEQIRLVVIYSETHWESTLIENMLQCFESELEAFTRTPTTWRLQGGA